MKKTLVLLTFLVLMVITACSTNKTDNPSSSTPPKDSQGTVETEVTVNNFPEKDITFIVPYGAGGGYDTLARQAAPILTKNLNNNPNIVVKNVTGGGGRVGVEELYRSNPDGYTIGNMSGGAVIPQVIGEAQYDLHNLPWIGIMSTDYYITAVSKQSNISSLEDLRNFGEVRHGMSGFASIDGIGPVIMADKMEFNIRSIGHQGSQEAVLSAMRGDVDLVTYPLNVILPLAMDGELIPLWTSSPERIPELPDIPTLKELGYESVANVLVLPRPIAAAPGTPEDIVEILREAFQKVLEDEEYQDLVINMNKAAIGTSDLDETKQVINNLFELLSPYKDLLSQ